MTTHVLKVSLMRSGFCATAFKKVQSNLLFLRLNVIAHANKRTDTMQVTRRVNYMTSHFGF